MCGELNTRLGKRKSDAKAPQPNVDRVASAFGNFKLYWATSFCCMIIALEVTMPELLTSMTLILTRSLPLNLLSIARLN